jgi:AcrR family transcriptional regulator
LTIWAYIVNNVSVQIDGISEVDEAESRHDALLEAAVGVFARYGFRKASMDEVARAAGVSRQGLYLLFEDKEALFRKAVAYKLTRQLRAAVSQLSNQRNSLEARIIGACDEWAGRYAGLLGTDSADLMCASTALAGATLAHYEAQFEKALVDAIEGSALANFCTAAGLLPADVARAVRATARGLKHGSKSRQEFVQVMTAAVRMICAPLNPHPE